MNLRLKEKLKLSQTFFLNWNESAAKTENDIVSIKLVELEVIRG